MYKKTISMLLRTINSDILMVILRYGDNSHCYFFYQVMLVNAVSLMNENKKKDLTNSHQMLICSIALVELNVTALYDLISHVIFSAANT